MKEYQTEQRKRLIAFFASHCDQQFTIDELFDSISDISISTIYRNVNQLVMEGSVQRFQKEGSRKSLYQYIGNSDCTEHLHLKCNKCGRIMHMDDKSMEIVMETVGNNFDFNIDINKTILFGSCLSCK